MIKNNKDLIFVIIVITWLLFGIIGAVIFHLPVHIASMIMVSILCIIILFQKFTRFGAWLETNTLLVSPKKVKNKITKLSIKRQHIVKTFNESYDEITKEYVINEPRDIDDLGDVIFNLIKNNIDILELEFIIEELTKLGHAPCVLYDDNGHFAIVGDGFHTISKDGDAIDMNMSFHVEKPQWCDTIRQALKKFLYI